MLLRFRVSNHLSFRDLQEVSFVASSLKERKGYLIDCAAAPNNSVVPAAVVYGANASGKSNLVDAMQTMRAMVLEEGINGQMITLFDTTASRHPTRPLYRNGWTSTRRLTVDSRSPATAASSLSDAG